ncbi:putative ribonuclease H-like domain-containing protein [Tanacetum coccineum]
MDYPQRALQNKGIVNSGCSRHMTGNKAYLAEYQDFNGGLVAFGGSKGYITGKGTEDNIDAGNSEIEAKSAQDYFVLPIWSSYTSTVKSSKAKNTGEEPNKNPDLKTDEKPVDKEDQVFLDELERLKRQEQDANDAAKALRKGCQRSEDLVFKQEYDSEIPALEDMYDHPTDGHRQEEGIDYDEVFAPVARIEAIRIFLAFASYMGFIVYQMDVKSAFLYGKIDEELPEPFYVDDIIFGSTKRSWCDEFEALMKSRFQMSSMGELTFFLGLQVKQKEDGIFISQDKSMIGSLMYLTASRPDIMFAVCACSRFQVTPKTSHLNVVKRIFRYLKGKPKLGLWYPRVSSFDLEAYSDSGTLLEQILTRKIQTGGSHISCEGDLFHGNEQARQLCYSTTEADYVR